MMNFGLREYKGEKYRVIEDNAILAKKCHISRDIIEQYGPLFIVITEGVKGGRELDRYPCILMPENMSRYGFTKDEVHQLIMHELGHLYVPGAMDRGLQSQSIEKEILADSFTTHPIVMIDALKKLQRLLIKYISTHPVSPMRTQQWMKQFDVRIAALRKRSPWR